MKKRIVLLIALLSCLLTISCQRKASIEELWIPNGDRNIYGLLNRPAKGPKKQPVLIISHGFNGSHDFGKNYFPLLDEL